MTPVPSVIWPVHVGMCGSWRDAHVMLTTRSIGCDGSWLCKQRKNYILDQNGNKIYDSASKRYACGRSIKTNDWDNAGNVELWREGWAKACNRAFERNGIDKQVTHKSYERQELRIEPTKHLGKTNRALERRGLLTERILENREVLEKRLQLALRKGRSRGRSR